MKGISLAINTIIILFLAMMVLVVVSYMFITGAFTGFHGINVEQAITTGCEKYIKLGNPPEEIIIGDITGDGVEDSLLIACQLYTVDSKMTSKECAEICKKKFPYSGID